MNVSRKSRAIALQHMFILRALSTLAWRAALLCLSAQLCFCSPEPDSENGSNDFVAVATADTLQRAVSAGVRHILLTQHLSMLSSTKSRPEDRAAESLQTAILRIQASTISIVVRIAPLPALYRTSITAHTPGYMFWIRSYEQLYVSSEVVSHLPVLIEQV